MLSYLKLCLYHVHDARRRDLEIPWWLALNETFKISALDVSRTNKDHTVADDERRGGRELLFGNCAFNIESIPVCDGGTPVHVTEVALDHINIAIHQDDSSCVPNRKQPESSWHRVSGATCQL